MRYAKSKITGTAGMADEKATTGRRRFTMFPSLIAFLVYIIILETDGGRAGW